MSFIEVKNLSKTFKVYKRNGGLKNAVKSLFKRTYTEVRAVQDISFNIDKGEIVAYIGPNGAGKSTTIKMLCGILYPDKGSILIEGLNPYTNRMKFVSNIGVVFGQKSQLWWDIPVEDSFRLLKKIYNVSDSVYKDNVNELIELLNLQELLKTPVRQLSLGQRMRCELAASLIHSPKILFLDEPTIGLDAVSKVAVRNFIKKINKTRKVTIILTSHDMNDIESLTDRVIVIGHGTKLYDGTLNGIKNKFSKYKKLEILATNLNVCPNVKHAKVLEKNHNRVLLNVDMEKTTISTVVEKYSKCGEINDINILSENIDEIIIKLYREYNL